jgi:hypothetical protein
MRIGDNCARREGGSGGLADCSEHWRVAPLRCISFRPITILSSYRSIYSHVSEMLAVRLELFKSPLVIEVLHS